MQSLHFIVGHSTAKPRVGGIVAGASLNNPAAV